MTTAHIWEMESGELRCQVCRIKNSDAFNMGELENCPGPLAPENAHWTSEVHRRRSDQYNKNNIVVIAGTVKHHARRDADGIWRTLRGDEFYLSAIIENNKLRDAIRDCAQQFRDYERRHLLKDTDDGRRKAEINAEMARKCEELL